MIKIGQILDVRSQNNLQICTSVILRQEFVNNFATLTQAPIILPFCDGRKANAPIRNSRFDFAPVNAPVPSPFSRKIYCDIMKSIVLNTYVTVDLTADRCISCRLLALAPMHLPSTVTQNLFYLSLDHLVVLILDCSFITVSRNILLCFKKRTHAVEIERQCK